MVHHLEKLDGAPCTYLTLDTGLVDGRRGTFTKEQDRVIMDDDKTVVTPIFTPAFTFHPYLENKKTIPQQVIT